MTNEAKSSGPPDASRLGGFAAGWPAWLRIAIVGRRPSRTLLRAVVIVVVCFVTFRYVLLPIRITGVSMSPNYRDGGINLVNRLAYLRHGPRRGDVVSIRLAGKHVMYMKRVIGLPGETIAFVNGHVFINGQFLVEPYMKLPCSWDREPVKLGSDDYFVVGDNRFMSQEYHTFGIMLRRRIVGKVLL